MQPFQMNSTSESSFGRGLDDGFRHASTSSVAKAASFSLVAATSSLRTGASWSTNEEGPFLPGGHIRNNAKQLQHWPLWPRNQHAPSWDGMPVRPSPQLSNRRLAVGNLHTQCMLKGCSGLPRQALLSEPVITVTPKPAILTTQDDGSLPFIEIHT